MIANTDRILGLLSLTPCTINEAAKRLSMSRWTVRYAMERLQQRMRVFAWEIHTPKGGRPEYKYGLRWRE